MPKAAVNGIQIHYEVAGSGIPVMLLVGLPGVGKGWGPQASLFADNYMTIVPDQRGAGQSSWPSEGYTIEEHASDMAGVLASLDCGPCHIVGSSTGGAIAQVMALDHADVVRSVTLLGSWAGPDDFFRHQFETRKRILLEAGMKAYIDASVLMLFSPAYFRDHYDEVRRYCDQGASGASDPAIMIKRIDMILGFDQRKRLGEIGSPTLVLVGGQDACTPPYFSEEIAAAVPRAELTVLEGGHLVYWEHPDEFFQRVARFLRAH
ncbi:MAG: alpha/beta fold hydrolase [Actinomycetota bacterium]